VEEDSIRRERMYYALTINADQIITGVHESASPIAETTFAENPELAEDTVLPIDEPNEYQAGQPMAAYTDGVLRPLIDRINEGLASVPEGVELIDGELVKTDVPVEEAPPKLIDRIRALETELAALKPKIQEARKIWEN
jgi:hypothetical protein